MYAPSREVAITAGAAEVADGRKLKLIDPTDSGCASPSSAVPWQYPSSVAAPPRGAPGGSGRLDTPRGGAGSLGARPLPWVFELAASNVADSTTLGF